MSNTPNPRHESLEDIDGAQRGSLRERFPEATDDQITKAECAAELFVTSFEFNFPPYSDDSLRLAVKIECLKNLVRGIGLANVELVGRNLEGVTDRQRELVNRLDVRRVFLDGTATPYYGGRVPLHEIDGARAMEQAQRRAQRLSKPSRLWPSRRSPFESLRAGEEPDSKPSAERYRPRISEIAMIVLGVLDKSSTELSTQQIHRLVDAIDGLSSYSIETIKNARNELIDARLAAPLKGKKYRVVITPEGEDYLRGVHR